MSAVLCFRPKAEIPHLAHFAFRRWSPVSDPNATFDGLNAYPNVDLADLRHALNAWGRSDAKTEQNL
jgi:hypothetical protein